MVNALRIALVALLSSYAASQKVLDESGTIEKKTQAVINPNEIQIGAIRLREGSKEKDSPPLDPKFEELQLPDYLNLNNFDEFTSKQLTMVEFFSPYCPHCKELFPKWKDTYLSRKAWLKENNIEMRQVSCIESGDLCDREDVTFYPNIRIYVPLKDKETGKSVEGKSKFVSIFPRTLPRTKESFVRFLKNAVVEFSEGASGFPSESIAVNNDQILTLLSGDHFELTFAAFFPSTDEQWKESEETGKNTFPKLCPDCLSMKQTWDKLSTRILTTVTPVHINCGSNRLVCESLGFESLTGKSRFSTPKFVMFLPKAAGVVRIDYEGECDLEKLRLYALRLFDNFQYETLTIGGLSDSMSLRRELPSEPIPVDLSIPVQAAIVYYFDADELTAEERAMLPYVLELVTQAPFYINLYSGKSVNFERAIRFSYEALISFVHNGVELAQDKKDYFDAMLQAATLSKKPTFYMYRDDSLIPTAYQSFSMEDVKNKAKIKTFLERSQFPVVGELRPDLWEYYFPPGLNSEDRKVVINFISTDNSESVDLAIHKLSLGAHEYYFSKQKFYFDDFMSLRDRMEETIYSLRAQDAASIDTIKEMRRKYPNFFKEDGVLFTYIDLANVDLFDNLKNWNFEDDDFLDGDTIILSADNKEYWDTDIEGKKLTNDPDQLRATLFAFIDPETPSEKIKLKLVPLKGFSMSFKREYLLVPIVLVGAYISVKYFQKRSRRKFKLRSTGGYGGLIGSASSTQKSD